MTQESDCPPDFNALIERVIGSQLRENLTLFLWSYRFHGDGEPRTLRPSEVRLIRSAIDAFMADNSLAQLGMIEIRNLEKRLASFAANDCDFTGEAADRMRNTCFDAMVCIKALEARLAKEVQRNDVLSGRLSQRDS